MKFNYPTCSCYLPFHWFQQTNIPQCWKSSNTLDFSNNVGLLEYISNAHVLSRPSVEKEKRCFILLILDQIDKLIVDFVSHAIQSCCRYVGYLLHIFILGRHTGNNLMIIRLRAKEEKGKIYSEMSFHY